MTFGVGSTLRGLAALGLALCGAAFAGKAHQHGVARLDLAVDGGTVTIAVEMPLDALVGFERSPRTGAERQAAAAALARMRDGAALLRLDAAAQCKLVEARVEAPELEQPAAAAPNGDKGDGHADLDATYTFACAQPARLATLEVGLFDAFRRVERVEVQAALPQGQRKAVLRRSAKVVQLAR